VLEALGLPANAPITINGAPNTTLTSFLTTTGATLNSFTLDPAPENRNSVNNGLLPASAYSFYTGYRSRFNFNEFAGSFPEINRKGAFAAWERSWSENVRTYGDMFFQMLHQIDELAPYATNNFEQPGQTTMVIPARTPNPILTPAEVARGGRTAAIGAFNPFNPFNQDISGVSRIRLAEWGNRIFHTRNTAFAVTGGLAVTNIADKWNLDAGIRYGQIDNSERNKLISTSRWLRAVNAADPIFNPASPSYIGTTVPYNPFGYFRNPIATNAAPVEFATHWTRDENRSATLQANFLLNTSNLLEVPAGDVGFAFGAEYRREKVHQAPDSATQSGDVLATPAAAVTIAQRKIASYFAEVEIPIFSEKRSMDYAHGLSLNIAARYEDFLTSGRSVFVPKFGLRWQPLADGSIVVRGSWGEGFREPSLFELYSSITTGLLAIDDPLTGNTEPEQSVSTAGNPRLEAEESESRNIGVVWSPKGRLEGFTASFDLWRITREGTVFADNQDTVDRSVGRDILGNPKPGGLRPGESVVRGSTGLIVLVNSVFLNAGVILTEGFDAAASYTWNTKNWGRLDFGALATYLDSYKVSTVPGVDPVEAIDMAIDSGDDAYLRWKGQAFVGWTWKGLSARVTGNYTHSFDDLNGDPFTGEAFRVDSTMIYDVQLGYKFFPSKNRQDTSWFSDIDLTVGANNVFDKDPPFVADGGNNSNGYPGFLYNNTGRWVYVRLEKKL
jgi:outer membrane receptor protein involved in Fe transport